MSDPYRHFYAPYVERDLARSIEFWRDRVPETVAVAQARWELDQRIRRAVDAGATYADIARHMAVSATSVRNRDIRARRTPATRYKQAPGRHGHSYAQPVHVTAPVVRYIRQPPWMNPDTMKDRGAVL